jgi:calcium channel MID1
MLLSRFTPAQSRLLATVGATYILLALSPFAYATEDSAFSAVESLSQSVLESLPLAFAAGQDDNSRSGGSDGSGGYAPDFDYFDRSLLGRQEPQGPQIDDLVNNKKVEKDINPGQTLYFVLKQGLTRLTRSDEAAIEALEARGTVSPLEGPLDEAVAATEGKRNAEHIDTDEQLEKRQTGNRVWISANACRQPNPPTDNTGKSRNHPQLVMYASTSPRNQKPGPDSTDNLVTPPTGLLFEKGFANLTLQTNSDIYIGISAPNLEPDWFGSWHFEIAASTDGPFHGYDNTNPYLFMIDTDSDSALFITYNLSDSSNDADKWKQNNPFTMYAFEVDAVAPFNGMERSLCAMENYSNLTNATTEISITTKFGDNLPKSQFHVQGLKAGKNYYGFLAAKGVQEVLQLPGGGTVRGGGMVFQQFNFTTKAGTWIRDTIRILFDNILTRIQTAHAKSSSTSISATRLPTPYLPTLHTKITTTHSKPFTTTKPKHTSRTSPDPSRNLPATPRQNPNTHSLAHAKTAQETIRTGCVPS